MESGQHIATLNAKREFRAIEHKCEYECEYECEFELRMKARHMMKGLTERPILNEEKKCKEHDNIIKGHVI